MCFCGLSTDRRKNLFGDFFFFETQAILFECCLCCFLLVPVNFVPFFPKKTKSCVEIGKTSLFTIEQQIMLAVLSTVWQGLKAEPFVCPLLTCRKVTVDLLQFKRLPDAHTFSLAMKSHGNRSYMPRCNSYYSQEKL